MIVQHRSIICEAKNFSSRGIVCSKPEFTLQHRFYRSMERTYSKITHGKLLCTNKESCKILRSDQWLWHGSTSAGNRKHNGFCDIWRSSSSSHSGIASPLSQTKSLMFAPREVPCYRKLVVICVEVNFISNFPIFPCRTWVNTTSKEESENESQIYILKIIHNGAILNE